MDNLEEKINSLFSSPESLAQIKKLAEALSGGNSESAAAPAPNPGPTNNSDSTSPLLDPKMMQLFASLMREYSAPSEATGLINALRPYLKADRVAKIDKAMSIAKLAKAAKVILPEIGGKFLV